MHFCAIIVCLLACAGTSAAAVTSEEAWRIGWPALAGPQGSFAPLSTGVTLLDDYIRYHYSTVAQYGPYRVLSRWR